MNSLGCAMRYRELGWSPIPLTVSPEHPKGLPPRGVTGYRGTYYATGELACLTWDDRNLALRLPGDVVGIDVDAYHGGMTTLSELERELGPLPPTVVAHNGRDDGSGIRLFRVPNGSMLRGDPGPGIDMVQWFHRYVIAAPSRHPEGRQYVWHDQADDGAVDWPPHPGDLPDLPWSWVRNLSVRKAGRRSARAATQGEVQRFLEAHADNQMPEALEKIRCRLSRVTTSRHDTAVRIACQGLREAASAYYPAEQLVVELETWWSDCLADDPRRRDGGELGAIIAWAVAEVDAEINARADPDGVGSGSGKPKVRDAILALGCREYALGRTEDGRTYLVPADGPNVALFGSRAKSSLSVRYFERTGESLGRTPLDEAWQTIEGMAQKVEKVSLPMRVARHGINIVLDIGDTLGKAIIVKPSGWEVVERSRVTFRRSNVMLPLPTPVRGGTLSELFDLVNVAAAHRDLFAAWMTSTLFADLPHPTPVLLGEQGAAKSSTARSMSQLLDPCTAATQKPPKSEDDWAVTCTARWIVAVDNVSSVSDWWSDALCRTITGDGWLRRQLYTDEDVVATSYRRCVILNGITLGASLRPDLAERLIPFTLERPTEWLTERCVEERLADMRPRVLGAFLDLAAATLAQLPLTPAPTHVRMADFAHLLAAYDSATGSEASTAYFIQLDTAFGDALDSDMVAGAVIDFMAKLHEWTGMPHELLHELNTCRLNDRSDVLDVSWTRGQRADDRWPSTPQALTAALKRSQPLLRRVGISIDRTQRRTKRGLPITLRRTAELTSATGDTGDDKFPFVVSE